MEYVDLQTVPFCSEINLERPAGNWIREDFPGQNFDKPPGSVGRAAALRKPAMGQIRHACTSKDILAEKLWQGGT
jgi:hypothetical protein